jgi:hypothetical protein
MQYAFPCAIVFDPINFFPSKAYTCFNRTKIAIMQMSENEELTLLIFFPEKAHPLYALSAYRNII